MPRRPPLSRRLIALAMWPAGIALTSWSYLWRTTPMHRREGSGSLPDDAPPPLPAGVEVDEVQQPGDGAGPLLHRVYLARVREAQVAPEELIARVAENPNLVAPREFARFHKVHGDEGQMRPGDEFVVRMPGPWDGPVRVVDVTPTSFRFATLAGHIEAGQIEWRAQTRDGDLLFQVESWAQSGDRLSNLMHNRLRMAKEVQLHMWTSVLERVARLTRGRLLDGVDIETRLVELSQPRRRSHS